MMSTRSVLNTRNNETLHIVYKAPLDDRMKVFLLIQGLCNPCSGLACATQKAFDNSYVMIQENRVEVNMPTMFQCCVCLDSCQVNDYVQVYYFDKRQATKADEATACSPICCPIGLNPACGGYLPPALTFMFPCCPTCFGSCGQGAVLHGPLPSPLCCHQFAQIPFLADAGAFVENFNRAKAAYSGVGATPGQQPPVQETME